MKIRDRFASRRATDGFVTRLGVKRFLKADAKSSKCVTGLSSRSRTIMPSSHRALPISQDVLPLRAMFLSLFGRLSRTRSDLLTRSCPIPRGWRNHTPRYHLICRRSGVALENGILYEKSVNTYRQTLPGTVNFSSVPRFALFTRVSVFPFVPLFNSPTDMLSVRHKDGRDHCGSR